jgi:hypothetical protein
LKDIQHSYLFFSESKLLHDWRFTAYQFVLATIGLRLTTCNFISQLNTCYSPYATSSLTRGWVCRLQLLLVLASVVILRSESRETHDQILLSQIRDALSLEGQVPVFISPRNRVARLYPQPLGSLFVASYDSQGYGGGIASGCRLDGREVGVRVPVRARFSHLYVAQNGSGAHPASYSMGTGGSFPEGKANGE